MEKFLEDPRDRVFVDVREPYEFQKKRIKGFKNIPLADILNDAKFVDRPVVLMCRSGARAKVAAMKIEEKFPNAEIFVVDENILE